MAGEPLTIFDPRRNFQLQGFTGRGATTTIHDASATGVSVSGIFQAAEDFAALGLYNAHDYYNHLRVKHLPRTDLSGLVLDFDIEYDHALDGAMRMHFAETQYGPENAGGGGEGSRTMTVTANGETLWRTRSGRSRDGRSTPTTPRVRAEVTPPTSSGSVASRSF